jgi:hypothetical protein
VTTAYDEAFKAGSGFATFIVDPHDASNDEIAGHVLWFGVPLMGANGNATMSYFPQMERFLRR